MPGHGATDRPFYDCTRSLWDAAPNLAAIEHRPALNALVSLSSLTSAFRHARRQVESQLPVRVERAIAWIEHHLGDDILNAQRVADAQHVSRRYLDELFARSGHSIESWIWERRLQRAAQELATADSAGRSLLAIALDVGFKSPSHFSRSFARRFGMSPRVYRKRQQDERSTR